MLNLGVVMRTDKIRCSRMMHFFKYDFCASFSCTRIMQPVAFSMPCVPDGRIKAWSWLMCRSWSLVHLVPCIVAMLMACLLSRLVSSFSLSKFIESALNCINLILVLLRGTRLFFVVSSPQATLR